MLTQPITDTGVLPLRDFDSSHRAQRARDEGEECALNKNKPLHLKEQVGGWGGVLQDTKTRIAGYKI